VATTNQSLRMRPWQRSPPWTRCTGRWPREPNHASGFSKQSVWRVPQGGHRRRTDCAWRGRGAAGIVQGASGDLYLAFVWQPHRLFKAWPTISNLKYRSRHRGRAWRAHRSAQPGRSLDVERETGKTRGGQNLEAWRQRACRRRSRFREPILRASNPNPSLAQAIGSEALSRACENLHIQPRFIFRRSTGTKAMAEEILLITDDDNPTGLIDFLRRVRPMVHDDVIEPCRRSRVHAPLTASNLDLQARHPASGRRLPLARTISASTLPGMALRWTYLERMESSRRQAAASSNRLLPMPLEPSCITTFEALHFKARLAAPAGHPASAGRLAVCSSRGWRPPAARSALSSSPRWQGPLDLDRRQWDGYAAREATER